MLDNLSDSERFELEQLWQMRELLKQINMKSETIVYMQLFGDISGGLYTEATNNENSEELTQWDSLQGAVKALRGYLASL